MDPMLLAMIGSIGLQFFTNSKNNAKVREIQESQKEYQKAAQLKQFERMRQLQADQARLAMELEKEIHEERIEEIEKEYDEVLDHLIDDFALQSWPLNVLPFIMRGESYGSLIRGGSRTIAIHCVLTPSNCSNFNKQIYQALDFRLEVEMNNHWNCQSTHPVMYYGGAWKKNSFNEDDLLTDIQLLRTELKNIPCLIITPHFDSNGLTFVINLWGMGEDKAAYTITPPCELFSYNSTYKKGIDYGYTEEMGFDLYNTTIEEFVPYIESLIGFIADKYFWSLYGTAPQLASIYSRNSIPLAKSIRNIYIENNLIINKESVLHRNSAELINAIENCLLFCDDKKQKISFISNVLDIIVETRLGANGGKMLEGTKTEAIKVFTYNDVCVFKSIKDIAYNIDAGLSKTIILKISSLIKDLFFIQKNNIDNCTSYMSLYNFIDCVNLHLTSQEEDSLLIEIDRNSHTISAYFESSQVEYCDSVYYNRYTIRTFGFLVPHEIKERNKTKFRIKKKAIVDLKEKLAIANNVNYFDIIVSIDTIKKYCERLIEDVKECTLSVKGDIPEHLIKNKSKIVIDHLLYIRITSESNQVVERMEYYDTFDEELSNYFLLSNTLILQ